MSTLFLELIKQLNSSVFVLILILALTFYILFKIGGWIEKFKNQDKRVSKLENLSETVIELKTKIDLIYQYTNPNKTIQAHSPLSLSPLGIAIKESINGDTLFAKYSQSLSEFVERANPKNAYDIQTESFKVVKEQFIKLLAENELIIIKDEAFKRGILLEDVAAIFGVLLRNAVLSKKGISISEVDKNAPQ